MLLIEVLSNDEGSVIEDAKYSAGSDAAAALSRPAGSRGKTVPRPYTPPGALKPDGDGPGKCNSMPGKVLVCRGIPLAKAAFYVRFWLTVATMAHGNCCWGREGESLGMALRRSAENTFKFGMCSACNM